MEMEADIHLLMNHLDGVLNGSSINRISLNYHDTYIRLNLEYINNEIISDDVHRAFLRQFLRNRKIHRFQFDKGGRNLFIDAAC